MQVKTKRVILKSVNLEVVINESDFDQDKHAEIKDQDEVDPVDSDEDEGDDDLEAAVPPAPKPAKVAKVTKTRRTKKVSATERAPLESQDLTQTTEPKE